MNQQPQGLDQFTIQLVIPYSDFFDGDQDPITWIEEIEKTFDANMISQDKKITVITSRLREELFKKVETRGHAYSDSTKTQIFVNGLCPEYCIHISTLTP
ncbi:9461_t:CDS:2, partial [Diversispora eburnea]